MLGTRRWFSVSKVVLSNTGIKGLKGKHPESDQGLRWANGTVWDTYDMLNLLRWVASCFARKPTSVGEKEKILVLHRNLGDARMLRLWLSHGQLPPLGCVLGSLSASATVLEAVGCLKQTVRRVRGLSVDLRTASMSAREKSVLSGHFPKRVCAWGHHSLGFLFRREKLGRSMRGTRPPQSCSLQIGS